MANSEAELDETQITVAEAKLLKRAAAGKFYRSIKTIVEGIAAKMEVEAVETHTETLTDLYDECVRMNGRLIEDVDTPQPDKERYQLWSEKVDKEYRDILAASDVYRGKVPPPKTPVTGGEKPTENVPNIEELELQSIRNKRQLDQDLEDSRVAEERRLEDIRRRNRRVQEDIEYRIQLARRRGDPTTSSTFEHQRTSTPFFRRDARFNLDASSSVHHNVTIMGGGRSHETISTQLQGATTDRWIFEDFLPGGPVSDGKTMVTMTMIAHLKPFAGDPKEWPLFIQSFKSMVHDVFPSDAQRVTLLLSMLDPSLRAGMSQILSTPHAYKEALQELRRKYGHPHLVSRTYIQHLTSLEPARSGEALQSFSTQLHGAVATLDAAGYGHELDSTAALENLVAKLPKHTIIRWGRHVSKLLPNIPTLRELDKWLENEVLSEKNILNLVSATPIYNNKQDRRQEGALHRPMAFNPTIAASREPQNPRNGALSATDSMSREQQTHPGGRCLVCKTEPGHGLSSCPQFIGMSPSMRAQQAYDLRNCFRCLGRNHFTRDCTKVKARCEECQQPHHTLLHGAQRVAARPAAQQRK